MEGLIEHDGKCEKKVILHSLRGRIGSGGSGGVDGGGVGEGREDSLTEEEWRDLCSWPGDLCACMARMWDEAMVSDRAGLRIAEAKAWRRVGSLRRAAWNIDKKGLDWAISEFAASCMEKTRGDNVISFRDRKARSTHHSASDPT